MGVVCRVVGGVMSFMPPLPSAMATPSLVSVKGTCRLLLPVSDTIVPVFTSCFPALCAALGFTMGVVCRVVGGVMSFMPPLPSAMATPSLVSSSGAGRAFFCAEGRDARCTPACFCVSLLLRSSKMFMVYLPAAYRLTISLSSLPALVFPQFATFWLSRVC